MLNGLKIRAAILLNGKPPTENISARLKDMLVICADGAYTWAANMGINPSVWVGDGDSLKGIPKGVSEIITADADKDKTDGELALELAISKGAESVTFFGAGGGRDDHYLGNLALLCKAVNAGISASMVNESCEIFCTASSFQKYLKPGTQISIVPFCGDAHILCTEGLRYPLHSKLMRCDETLGISNIVSESRVKIEVALGKVLIMVVRGPRV